MSERSQFRLLGERRFGPFFGVQFLGAMNDNLFKQALVILLAYQTTSFTAMSSDTLQNVAQALFVLPFFLFYATAGQLADKYAKSPLITVTVALELAIMVLGARGLVSTTSRSFSARSSSAAQSGSSAGEVRDPSPASEGERAVGGNGPWRWAPRSRSSAA
jgi:MFS family permease